MRIVIENLSEAYWVAQQLEEFLQMQSVHQGHATSRCGCSLCEAARKAEKVKQNLYKMTGGR